MQLTLQVSTLVLEHIIHRPSIILGSEMPRELKIFFMLYQKLIDSIGVTADLSINKSPRVGVTQLVANLHSTAASVDLL